MTIGFTLNGEARAITCPPETPLVTLLRDNMAMTATKEACSIGRCGACLVLIDGKTANACLTMAFQLEGATVITTEGLDADPLAATIRKALAAENAFQCGYCAPGFVMALVALLKENPSPSEDDIRKGLEGNICRCTGYHSIIRGALSAARMVQETLK
ncbi:(2Fe-2S)-binding protein [Rhizobium sp. C4]|uniref:(2Fe-2S)-binding protein n=1 Tax=Rhizobium sp. C4 TaxID=1349800 RepID=UPI001E30FA7E|nr:(2Fe-2S)-binding protein [Rhizobium sp. C4]MCD2172440.1 (2Fe-2S)-binding protein [Rhizobium sp. C4]